MAIQVRMRYAAIVFGLLLSLAANAQWTIVNLHPPGAAGSSAGDGRDGKQCGVVDTGAGPVAGAWIDGTWSPVQNAGEDSSVASGILGNNLVGWATTDHNARARLWRMDTQTWVDLNPDHLGSLESWCYGISGNQQVGMAQIGGTYKAGFWTGTAGSWVSLNPAGAGSSGVHGVDAGVQVGFAFIGGFKAGMWTGTPESWIDLTPDGVIEAVCYGVGDGQQVGKVMFPGTAHASLWTGSAESWVDLHPAGATESAAGLADGGLQLGSAVFAGVNRACLWYGTASSRVDLHSFLPQDSPWSIGGGLWQSGAIINIPGEFYNTTTDRYEAIMWVARMVAPTSYSMFRGTVFSGNLASLINSDGNKLVMRPGVVLQSSEPPVQIRINSTAPIANPNGISFSVEASASFPFAQQKVSLWNYDTGAYELLDTRVVTTSDDTLTATVRTNAARFIDNGTLAMRALVSYKAVGPSILYPWSARIDKVWWTFPG